MTFVLLKFVLIKNAKNVVQDHKFITLVISSVFQSLALASNSGHIFLVLYRKIVRLIVAPCEAYRYSKCTCKKFVLFIMRGY